MKSAAIRGARAEVRRETAKLREALGFRPEMVAMVRRAQVGPAIEAPAGDREFLEWLNALGDRDDVGGID